MLWKITKKFNFAADRIIPESLVFCLILTFLAFVGCMIATGTGFMTMLQYYYDGFFGSLFLFGFQMGLIILFAGTAAKAPAFEKLTTKLASIPKTPTGALLFMMIFSAVTAWINWAFGLILTPILSVYLCKNMKGKLHFPIMVAVGYAVMIMTQPLSLSTPVVAQLATPGHAFESITGILGYAETAFHPVNLIIYAALFVATALVVVFTRPPENEIVGLDNIAFATLSEKKVEKEEIEKTPANKMNYSRIIGYGLAALCTVYVIYYFINNGINMATNFIIFLFFTICAWLYPSPMELSKAIAGNIGSIPQTIVQFPMYGAIMGMMSSSDASAMLAEAIASIANAQTMPVFTYISASALNLFVPSQGGQWAIQGGIIESAAAAVGSGYGVNAVAFMFGDEGTNLLQPFYVIPALSVLGMKLKDIYGYMMFLWIIWFVITCVGFLVLPGILL